jgi:hypothetical protein
MTLQLVTHGTPCPQPPSGDLLNAGTAAAAELAKASPDFRSSIRWLSAHCAAFERVTFPAVRRALPDHAALQGQLALTRALEHTLLDLHQAINGDGRGTDRHLDVLVHGLRRQLDEHLSQAGRLLDDLHETLSSSQWEALLVRHRGALAVAPSRPHPYAPQSGMAARIAFAMDSALDRVREALDSQAIAAVPEQPCA